MLKKFKKTAFKKSRIKSIEQLINLVCEMFFGDFDTAKEKIIYLYYYLGWLDEKEIDPSIISGKYLAEIFQHHHKGNIMKTELYEHFKISKNKFREEFYDYLSGNNLIGNHTLSYVQTYNILKLWHGDGNWIRFEVMSKGELAENLYNHINGQNSKNKTIPYKKLAGEYSAYQKNTVLNKSGNKLSPADVINFLKHIGFDDPEDIKMILSPE